MNAQEIRKCDLCEDTGPFKVLVEQRASDDPRLSMLGIEGNYRTVACRKCGWIFKPIEFTGAQLEKLYDIVGGSATSDLIENDTRSADLLAFVTNIIEITPSQKLTILDVGGGIGQVTRAFAEAGHVVHVLDMSKNVVEDSRFTFHRGTLADFSPPHLFDLVMLNHVMEHVWEPSSQLAKCRSLLKEGGHVYIEVPFELYTPFVKKKLGDPCHVGYFSKHTLQRFLRKSQLSPVTCERTLGRYNSRRVMIIRALGKKLKHIKAEPPNRLVPQLPRVALEMIHPYQLLLMAKRTRRPTP